VATRILEAATQLRTILNMPRYTYILTMTMAVPVTVRDFIYDFMGVGENMADFKQTKHESLKEQ
jgi:hypothetical protein